jgi:hypothetical protein
VEAFAVNFLTDADVGNLSSIALDIPDFEGTATMRIFANSSQTEIGCFRAVMHNGRSFSHPYAVSSGLAGFTLFAIVSSFITAIYGVSISHMRTHYAHAFSVLVLFEAFHTIYLTGALSVDWPSVLPAWRNNFAWSAGIIRAPGMVDSLSGFSGVTGNASQVGGAGSAVINTDGGLAQAIYGRSMAALSASSELYRRSEDGFNATAPWPYSWHGHPVQPGLPMPGTWSAFAGNLVPSRVPSATAFMVSFIWWLVAIGVVIVAITVAKLSLDLLTRTKVIKSDGFDYFRSHLPGYLGFGVLRTVLVASFPLTTLALLQFNMNAPAGPIAIAAIVFVLLLLGLGGLITYSCYFRLRFGKYEMGPDQIVFEQGKLFKTVPFPAASRASKLGEAETAAKKYGSVPFFRIGFVDEDPNRGSIHKDEAYLKRFGWLTAHYRRTRWWFFALWFSYQFIRACFLGGGSRSPLAQVFGLFVLEIIAFVVFVKLRPYEGQRNAVVAVWMLGVCKIVTAGFSIAFLRDFGISRILSTVLGIIIIVIQAALALVVLALVVVSMVSSWMSIHRNRETFRPEALDSVRVRYYEHMQEAAPDLPPSAKPDPSTILPPSRTFSVNNVRRARKIEDEDEDAISELDKSGDNAAPFGPINRPCRTNSVSSRYSVGSLPRRARPHRASWSAKDFAEWDQQQAERPESAMGSIRGQHNRQRSNSLRQQAHINSASQTSLRINPDLYERTDSANFRRPPLTPAHEVAEEQAMNLDRIVSNDEREEAVPEASAKETTNKPDVSPPSSPKDTEPFPILDEKQDIKP